MKIVADEYMTIKVSKGERFNNGGCIVTLNISDGEKVMSLGLSQGTATGEKQVTELINALRDFE